MPPKDSPAPSSTAIVPVNARFSALKPAEPGSASLAEILAANFSGPGDVGISPLDLERIKVPGGGGPAFTIKDPDGSQDAAKEVRGIIVGHTMQRAWWLPSENGETSNSPPSCSSRDMLTGHGDNGSGKLGAHDCATCPQAAWGSSAKGGKGQACKQMALVLMLREGREDRLFPSLLIAPPTSLRGWQQYRIALSNRQLAFFGAETILGLVDDRNKAGTKYARVTFRMGRVLDAAEVRSVLAYSKSVQALISQLRAGEAMQEQQPQSGGNAEEERDLE